jgi:hypothetical protein
LGQWLFAKPDIDQFVQRKLPSVLRRFFWDVRLAELSVDRHRDFILGRLLEFGDRQALAWVFRTYPLELVAAFLKGRGADVLSRRAWQFWALQVGLSARMRGRSSWRSRGRSWGGLR